MTYQLFYILPLIFIFAGIILILVSNTLNKKMNKLKNRCTVKVNSQIVHTSIENLSTSIDFDNNNYTEYYWYKYYVNEKEYIVKSKIGLKPGTYKENDNVEIMYNPDNIEEIYNPNDGTNKIPLYLRIVGIPFLFLGLTFLIIIIIFKKI